MLILSFVLSLATIARADFPLSAPVPRAVINVRSAVTLAAGPADALAVWVDRRAGRPRIYATRIGLDGLPSADGGVPLDDEPRAEASPAVVWTGTDYLVAADVPVFGNDDGGLRLTRVTLDGPVSRALIPAADFDPTRSVDRSRLVMATNGGGRSLIVFSPASTSGPELHPTTTGVWGVFIDRELHVAGPAFPISSDIAANAASVASNGSGFAVTWRDVDAASVRVRVTTVSATGAIGAVSTLATLSTATPLTPPAIAWNGQRYLVAFADTAMHARFVESDGTPSGAPLDFGDGSAPALAWNGSEFLLAFTRAGNGSDIVAARLDATGRALEPASFAIAASAGDQQRPAIAALGGRFLVAWDDVDATRVALTGSASSAILARGLASQTDARGAVIGREAGFAWTEASHIFFGRATVDGVPLDGGGIDLGPGTRPRIATSGVDYLVTWLLDGTLHGRRIAGNGDLLESFVDATRPEGTFSIQTAIGSNGRDFLVAIVDGRTPETTGTGPLHFLAVPAGSPARSTPYLASLFDTTSPSVSWTRSSYVVVYDAALGPNGFRQHPDWQATLVLLDASGNVIDGPKPVPSLAPSQFAGDLAAFGAGVEAVVHAEGARLPLVRLDAAGNLLDKRDIAVCPAGCSITDFAWTGVDFAVAYNGIVQRIGADGTLLGAGFPLPAGTFNRSLLAGSGRLGAVYTRLVTLPEDPAVTISRAFFEWLPAPRRRAVR